MKSKRKAQIKMFETIAVLVVFFFLIVFGVSFYFVMQRSSYNRQVERNSQLISIQLTQKISDIPELDCALAGIQIENCIDKIKLERLNEELQKAEAKLTYFDLLGYSKIDVRTIYPDFVDYDLYEREPDAYSSAYKNQIPMLLYDGVKRQFAFGVLEVTTYVS
jgi:hypothetical protein